MERITSFSVDHRKLTKGVYVSRIDGDLINQKQHIPLNILGQHYLEMEIIKIK